MCITDSHGLRRQQSLKDLQFPYAYRDGQKGLAAAVYRSIDQGRNLFIQAPTGVGKTLSTVFPSLKAMGEGSGDKLFYLAAKSITRSVAEDAFRVMRDLQQLYFTTVTITGKEKLCVLDKPACNPETCPVAKGHYDRVNDAVYDILHEEMGITRELVLEYAKRHNVCPFEFCLDITNWADGIICDYKMCIRDSIYINQMVYPYALALGQALLIPAANTAKSRVPAESLGYVLPQMCIRDRCVSPL